MIQWAHICAACHGWVTATVPHVCPAQAPYPSVSARITEALVGAMQAEGPDRTTGRGHRAYGEYLAVINPPLPEAPYPCR